LPILQNQHRMVVNISPTMTCPVWLRCGCTLIPCTSCRSFTKLLAPMRVGAWQFSRLPLFRPSIEDHYEGDLQLYTRLSPCWVWVAPVTVFLQRTTRDNKDGITLKKRLGRKKC